MKIDFELPTDGTMHRYCFSCKREGATQVKQGKITKYHCDKCGATNDRAIYFDKHKAWLDKDKELWHESAGVFVRNNEGKYLFYKRTEYPFALTIGAGHVDEGETGKQAAQRELEEETGIKGDIKHIGTADIVGDSCSAAADSHRWHAYLLEFKGRDEVSVLEEGENVQWLTLDEAKSQGLVFVVGEVIRQFRKQLD